MVRWCIHYDHFNFQIRTSMTWLMPWSVLFTYSNSGAWSSLFSVLVFVCSIVYGNRVHAVTFFLKKRCKENGRFLDKMPSFGESLCVALPFGRDSIWKCVDSILEIRRIADMEQQGLLQWDALFVRGKVAQPEFEVPVQVSLEQRMSMRRITTSS